MNISIPITNYRNCYSQQLGEGQEQEQEQEQVGDLEEEEEEEPRPVNLIIYKIFV